MKYKNFCNTKFLGIVSEVPCVNVRVSDRVKSTRLCVRDSKTIKRDDGYFFELR